MKSGFTRDEKRKFLLKKHIKNHLFEYGMDLVAPVLLTIFLLHLCKAENFTYGILVAATYSVVKLISNIYYYKKDYVDINIK